MNEIVSPAPGLRRGMSPLGGLLITLSGLSPGIGVFIVGAGLLHQVGSGAVPCFLVAIVVGVAMAQVYAELGSAFPNAGGEYAMVGRALAPEAGFALLAASLTSVSVALAFNCLGAGSFVQAAVPWLPTRPVAFGMIVVVTVLAVLSIRLNAVVTGAFLALEVASPALVAWLGAANVQRPVLPLILHPQMAAGGGLAPVPWDALGFAMAGGIYAFNGYGAAVYFAEEIRHAHRSLAGIIIASLALAALLQVPPMLGVLAGAPDLHAVFADEAPIAAFVRLQGGTFLGRLLDLSVAAAILNAMIVLVLGGARQFYASARDGSWPASINAALVRIHPRFGSPWIATLAVGLPGVALCYVPSRLLLMLLGGGNAVVYALLCVAVIAGRRSGRTSHGQFKMWLYPLPAVLGLAATLAIAAVSLMDADTGRPGLVIVLATMLAGVLYFRWGLQRRISWAFTDPT